MEHRNRRPGRAFAAFTAASLIIVAVAAYPTIAKSATPAIGRAIAARYGHLMPASYCDRQPLIVYSAMHQLAIAPPNC